MLLGYNLQAYEERGELHYVTTVIFGKEAITTQANKGIALFHQENYEGAMEIFDITLANTNNSHVPSLYYYGQCLQELGFIDEANQYMNKARAIDPNYQGQFIEILSTSSLLQPIVALFQ
jgi:tetratricopeptide (TPR) repeat protein